MLRPQPTRLELKPEDREEYEEAKRLQAAAGTGQTRTQEERKPSTAARIGLRK